VVHCAHQMADFGKDVLSGRTPPADIALGVSSDVDLALNRPAVVLDIASRTLHTPSGEVRFDGLVIATGARA
jgi:3-phenylpropionate/trans-cinnamate dioxygenase ferredoxin reductase subunit